MIRSPLKPLSPILSDFVHCVRKFTALASTAQAHKRSKYSSNFRQLTSAGMPSILYSAFASLARRWNIASPMLYLMLPSPYRTQRLVKSDSSAILPKLINAFSSYLGELREKSLAKISFSVAERRPQHEPKLKIMLQISYEISK